MTLPSVVVLDLDGTILQSSSIKRRAMLALFETFPEQYAAIHTYILVNGGVPRQEKITTILESILKLPATPEVVADYLTRYNAKLEDLLFAAPLVDGVAAFVAKHNYTFYVSSSAPESEVEGQLARTGLIEHFAAIFGRDTPKATALLEIKRRHPGIKIVFFGDSTGDWQAAQAAHVPFIAVVCERDDFVDHAVVKLKDFTSVEVVEQSISAALQTNEKTTL